MHEFHPSGLEKGAKFRESIRYKPGVSSERLDRAHTILTDALAAHKHETLTVKNFKQVTEHMQKDPRWNGLHSAGLEFKRALEEHVGFTEDES